MPRPRKANATGKATSDSSIGPLKIESLKMTEVALCILGTAPLIYNRMSEKAKRDLLLPPVEKNRAAKRQSLKHDPLREYRDSVYTDANPKSPTRLVFPAPAFKAAAAQAALEIPGATKSSIGRLLQVVGYQVRLYGVPQLYMCGVRTAGIVKQADIRTRAIVPEWATIITVRYPAGSIEPASVGNLFAAAGQICGVGDFRQEKGKGSFGLFELVNQTDKDFQRILKAGGAKEQDKALAKPRPFDEESAGLLEWFEAEIRVRGREQEVTRAA